MKTIGICAPIFPKATWKSRPLRPGRRTSSKRQPAPSTPAPSRNAVVASKHCTSILTDSSRSVRASLTDASSSIIQTMGVSVFLGDRDLSGIFHPGRQCNLHDGSVNGVRHFVTRFLGRLQLHYRVAPCVVRLSYA